jgi:hypothetical protein
VKGRGTLCAVNRSYDSNILSLSHNLDWLIHFHVCARLRGQQPLDPTSLGSDETPNGAPRSVFCEIVACFQAHRDYRAILRIANFFSPTKYSFKFEHFILYETFLRLVKDWSIVSGTFDDPYFQGRNAVVIITMLKLKNRIETRFKILSLYCTRETEWNWKMILCTSP